MVVKSPIESMLLIMKKKFFIQGGNTNNNGTFYSNFQANMCKYTRIKYAQSPLKFSEWGEQTLKQKYFPKGKCNVRSKF